MAVKKIPKKLANWQKKRHKITENNHPVTYIRLEQVSKLFPLSPYPGLGVVYKLRLQEEVGRWSKNIHILSILIP